MQVVKQWNLSLEMAQTNMLPSQSPSLPYQKCITMSDSKVNLTQLIAFSKTIWILFLSATLSRNTKTVRAPGFPIAGDGRGQESMVLVEKLFRTPEIALSREQTILALLLQCHRNIRKTCHFMEDLSLHVTSEDLSLLFSFLISFLPLISFRIVLIVLRVQSIPKNPLLQTWNSNGKEICIILANF